MAEIDIWENYGKQNTNLLHFSIDNNVYVASFADCATQKFFRPAHGNRCNKGVGAWRSCYDRVFDRPIHHSLMAEKGLKDHEIEQRIRKIIEAATDSIKRKKIKKYMFWGITLFTAAIPCGFYGWKLLHWNGKENPKIRERLHKEPGNGSVPSKKMVPSKRRVPVPSSARPSTKSPTVHTKQTAEERMKTIKDRLAQIANQIDSNPPDLIRDMYKCQICWETLSPDVVVCPTQKEEFAAEHIFCKKCFEKCRKKECPLCRSRARMVATHIESTVLKANYGDRVNKETQKTKSVMNPTIMITAGTKIRMKKQTLGTHAPL